MSVQIRGVLLNFIIHISVVSIAYWSRVILVVTLRMVTHCYDLYNLELPHVVWKKLGVWMDMNIAIQWTWESKRLKEISWEGKLSELILFLEF